MKAPSEAVQAVTKSMLKITSIVIGFVILSLIILEFNWVVIESDPQLKIQNRVVTYDGKPFSGVVFGQYGRFKPSFIKTYWEGQLSGYLIKWYSNRQLHLVQRFRDGKPHGMKRGWYADGKPKYKIEYVMGEAVGETWAWHSNGKISNYIRYGSKEESAYKSWTGVGKPFYNYVLGENGRIGMNGGQFCKVLTKSRRDYLQSLSKL